MYTPKEREHYFKRVVDQLATSDLVEGIVQLGSGVAGYKDRHSDIDLMVAAPTIEAVEDAREFVRSCFSELDPVYIKLLKLSEHVYLLIAFMQNGLEFNVSIVPCEALKVKSPLWKVIFDRTARVTEVMMEKQEQFERDSYEVSEDIPFEFLYSMRKFQTEVKRGNFIYALKMLEAMRDCTLQLQAHSENKKLHQFKAYETLKPEFIKEYLSTYPDEITGQKLTEAAYRLKGLFFKTVSRSESCHVDEKLHGICITE
ncbi:hypothetical protein LCM10_12400 [Rossellomorea aquimaris]|uniref:hypothetical protein n=1 Tax=Rossellomorea aquimaris TaxID=189382 RepID=UPI001CD3A377|nr:hypothetical protein [Rossellomorea aquimaris]MCA1055789.1 hypothetical protein [Rossellomorea aquimaris]